jgi:hypothetical protein
MNKIACQYAIVRFAPFVETEEFANIGIVILSAKHGFFGFRLESKRYGRITRFFEGVDARFYRKTVANLKKEMQRVKDILQQQTNNQDFSQQLFSEITRTRETIIRFSDVRTVLTNQPEQQLEALFAYYVEHNFVTKKYQQALLENDVRQLLSNANMGDRFTREKIGDAAYRVAFPFVDKRENNVHKIIKPLYLKHNDSTHIYNHGAAWLFKIQQLTKKKQLQPERVLFTLSAPQADTGNRFDAYKEIEQGLMETRVRVVSFSQNNQQIIEFIQEK